MSYPDSLIIFIYPSASNREWILILLLRRYSMLVLKFLYILGAYAAYNLFSKSFKYYLLHLFAVLYIHQRHFTSIDLK